MSSGRECTIFVFGASRSQLWLLVVLLRVLLTAIEVMVHALGIGGQEAVAVDQFGIWDLGGLDLCSVASTEELITC